MIDKKRLLFVCYGLGIGGIEKCLISLLNAMDMGKYSVDVLPLNPIYDLADSLKADCNILDPYEYAMNTTDTYQELKKRKAGLREYVRYAVFRILNKWGGRPWKLFRVPDKHYDIAVAYAHIPFSPYYVIDRVKADRKYMWYHHGRYVKGKNYKLDLEYYPKFNAIISVSEDSRKELTQAFLSIEERIKVIHNVILPEEIKRKAQEKPEEAFINDRINIVTVGRLCSEKNPEYVVQIADMLKKEGLIFCWYWVGGGELENQIRELVQTYGLSEQVKLLGDKENPYPYIYNCDIYVQPSEYEAFCTTTREAKILEKPIVVTDVGGMRDQFVPGEDCIMTDVNVEEVFQAVLYLAQHPEERQRLHNNLHNKSCMENKDLQCHYDLFDS